MESLEQLITSRLEKAGGETSEVFFELANDNALVFHVKGQKLVVRQDHSIPHTGGCELLAPEGMMGALTREALPLARCVWETSYCMALWALACVQGKIDGAARGGSPFTVVELGAGCGLLSLVLACLGAHVLATEQQGVLGNLAHNVTSNAYARGKCEYAELAWTHEDQVLGLASRLDDSKPDLIVGTDVVYAPTLVEPLLRTIWLLSRPRTEARLCLQKRCVKSTEMLMDLAPRFFSCVSAEQISSFDLAATFSNDLECFMLVLAGRRRPGA